MRKRKLAGVDLHVAWVRLLTLGDFIWLIPSAALGIIKGVLPPVLLAAHVRREDVGHALRLADQGGAAGEVDVVVLVGDGALT